MVWFAAQIILARVGHKSKARYPDSLVLQRLDKVDPGLVGRLRRAALPYAQSILRPSQLRFIASCG